jgi:hypothetical protein
MDQYQKLAGDLPLYAAVCLRIRPKAGALAPLSLNATQRFLDNKLDDQLERRGKVRALVLKGRQTGVSTYVGARFYHKVTHRRGCRARILTHRQDATDNLFGIVQRFHDHCDEELKPRTAASNAKELYFDRLDSGYLVATAGSREVGRSDTIQLFHGSEVAFWPSAESHIEGIGQAIADVPGTESILESTANGIDNLFYSLWMAAQAGDTEYEAIFLPWFLHEEYRAEPEPGWSAPEEFRAYAKAYDLDAAQLHWAWLKNRDLAVTLSGDVSRICWKFRQEYPATPSEAFQMSGEDPFIPVDRVAAARRGEVTGYGPLILGVDPARGGKDKTGMMDRQGRRLGGHLKECIDSDDLMHIAGVVVRKIDELRPKGLRKVVIDVTGLGAGIYDRLVEQGYGSIVEGINFGAKALEPDRYANRRAEMWDRKREWYDDPAGVQVPDDDLFQRDECSVVRGKGATKFDSAGRLVLESKDHIRERVGFRLISETLLRLLSPSTSTKWQKTFRRSAGLLNHPAATHGWGLERASHAEAQGAFT